MIERRLKSCEETLRMCDRDLLETKKELKIARDLHRDCDTTKAELRQQIEQKEFAIMSQKKRDR